MIKVCLLFDNLSVHNSMPRLPQDPYLDPHCTFFSKIKSADICKDWVRGLTKKSDQRLRFKFNNIIQEYNADRKMRQNSLGQILISYFHTLKAQMSELPLSSLCVNEKMTTP